MTRVAVAPSVMRWALDRSARSASSLQDSFPQLSEWLEGAQQPTLRQLESLARATATPLGFFFLSTPPREELPIPLYRTLGNRELAAPSNDLLETVHTMMRRQSWMREFMIDEGMSPLSYVNSAQALDSAPAVANIMRSTLRVSSRWASHLSTWTEALRTLRETMEACGILVAVNGVVGNNTHRVLDPHEFRGFVLADDYAPLVFVNGADAKTAQMFTLAHELAHVIKGVSAAFDLRATQPSDNATERLCNYAAAEFLVPESELRQYWPSARLTAEPFQAVAFSFKVSTLVAARRTLDLRLITAQDFAEFYEEYQLDDRHSRAGATDGGNFYTNQNLRLGRRFASTVVRAARQGKLLYSEAYRLTGLHGATFEHYAARLERRCT